MPKIVRFGGSSA